MATHIKDLPEILQRRCFKHQHEQGIRKKYYGKLLHGKPAGNFDWVRSPEGHDYWSRVNRMDWTGKWKFLWGSRNRHEANLAVLAKEFPDVNIFTEPYAKYVPPKYVDPWVHPIAVSQTPVDTKMVRSSSRVLYVNQSLL